MMRYSDSVSVFSTPPSPPWSFSSGKEEGPDGGPAEAYSWINPDPWRSANKAGTPTEKTNNAADGKQRTTEIDT